MTISRHMIFFFLSKIDHCSDYSLYFLYTILIKVLIDSIQISNSSKIILSWYFAASLGRTWSWRRFWCRKLEQVPYGGSVRYTSKNYVYDNIDYNLWGQNIEKGLARTKISHMFARDRTWVCMSWLLRYMHVT